jgi:von Willebrand factor type A domain
MVRSICLFLLLFAAACGSNGSSSGPCDVVPPDPSCNLTCDPQPGAPSSCPDGFYCNPDGKCYAQCTQTGNQCGDGYTCTYDGHCLPGDSGGGSGSGSNDCPRVAFTAKAVTPSILLVIDRSGSMNENFGNPPAQKWASVKSALVDNTNGVVSQLETKAYFGTMIYDTANQMCPRLTTVGRALNNVAALRTALETPPDGNASTPTAKSIVAATASFAAIPPPTGSPPIIVVATDGAPKNCSDEANTPEQNVVAAAAAAYAAGIKVIPLSVATDGPTKTHLQKVANAGAGVQAGQPNARLYEGNNPAELKAAFDAIIGGAVSCDLTVNASVTQEQAAAAIIRLNGRALTFGTEWVLVGDRTIRILGAACTMLKSTVNPAVDGTFPCGVVLE